jgi:hypothetical protein
VSIERRGEGRHDRTTQHNTTHNTIPLSHHTTTHHTIPITHEIFPPTKPDPFYKRRYNRPSTEPKLVNAVVLLPWEGFLVPCELVTVVVSEP